MAFLWKNTFSERWEMVERGCAAAPGWQEGDRSDGDRERWLFFALMALERARRGGRASGDGQRRDGDLLVWAGALEEPAAEIPPCKDARTELSLRCSVRVGFACLFLGVYFIASGLKALG